MKSRTFRVTGLCLAASIAAIWVLLAKGMLAAASVVLGLSAAALLVALMIERRRTERLEEALGRETERARQISDQAWQSALLGQVVDELRVSMDETPVLETAASALGNALKVSRAVLYGLDVDGRFRVRAQFAREGTPPLGPEASLPAVLASDRDLAERLSSRDLAKDEDPELRALAERLAVRSMVVVPVTRGYILAVQQCDRPRSWTSAEQRFIQRFADQLGSALKQGERYRKHAHTAEVRSGLLRVAHALSGTRESQAVLELATSVAAPLARCRASAIFAERGEGGYFVVAQNGFGREISQASVAALEPHLEDAIRGRAPLPLNRGAARPRCAETRDFGPLVLVPLLYGREVLGVLLFERGGSDEIWHGPDVEITQVVAELTASALKNARLFEALSSSEARYVDLYDNAPDLYQTVDPSGRILECNLTECLTLGYTKEELTGSRFENALAKESLSEWRSLQGELFDKGYVRDAGLKLRTREGRVIEVLVNASVILAAEGKPLSARVVMRDISEVRRLEHQLRQSQKLEMVGALAGGIAHDFNNVLGGILGYASLLRAQLRDRPLAGRYVETIERSAVRGAELTGRLLTASRKSPARKEPVNLNQVVEETLELLAHTFHKKVRIAKRLDASVRPVMADAGQLQQVMLNLCVNARDAMPEGGLLRVITEVEERSERLCLSVEDTGIGMEPSTMQRLFEPFFSTKGESGTGLGLSVVYGIVKSLGGDVRVNSSPGKGARFDIFLPVEWVEERRESPEVHEPVRGRGELILLVDDERVLRDLGKEILETHGYRVQAAESGEDAISFLGSSRDPVALVILDLVMPGIDGNETFRRLRRLDAAVPVLLSSGLTAEEAIQEALAEGATGFIPKPYGIGELTHAVFTALHTVNPPLVH